MSKNGDALQVLDNSGNWWFIGPKVLTRSLNAGKNLSNCRLVDLRSNDGLVQTLNDLMKGDFLTGLFNPLCFYTKHEETHNVFRYKYKGENIIGLRLTNEEVLYIKVHRGITTLDDVEASNLTLVNSIYIKEKEIKMFKDEYKNPRVSENYMRCCMNEVETFIFKYKKNIK